MASVPLPLSRRPCAVCRVPLPVQNRSGFCGPCGHTHRCRLCLRASGAPLPAARVCPECAVFRERLRQIHRGSRRPVRDDGWEEHLAELARRAADELELFPAPEGGAA
jgi:hypothetical protein